MRFLRLWWRKLGDENCGRKNRTDVIDFFQMQFSSPNFPDRNRRNLKFATLCLRLTFLRIYPSQSQDIRFCDIVSSSNSFENFKFSKMLLGEIGWWKSRPKKWKRQFDFFRSLFSSLNHPHTFPFPLQSAQDNRWVMKIVPKKSKMSSVWFLSATIFIAPSPYCNNAIESSSNIFGNLLIAISNLGIPRLQWEG